VCVTFNVQVTDALNAKRRVENELADVSADKKILAAEVDQLKAHVSSLEEQRNAQRALNDRLESSHQGMFFVRGHVPW